jgi:hypothetical protein
MPLFLIYCVFFVHDKGRNRRDTLLLHGCCRLEATGSRLKAGLLYMVFKAKVSSVEELPSVPNRTRTYAPHIRGSKEGPSI